MDIRATRALEEVLDKLFVLWTAVVAKEIRDNRLEVFPGLLFAFIHIFIKLIILY